MFPSDSGAEIEPALELASGRVAARGGRLLVGGRCLCGKTRSNRERCFLGEPPQGRLDTKNLKSRHMASR